MEQASRFDSRIGDDNNIILLEHEDRSGWNRDLIRRGYYYLNLSATGDQLSVYHIESAILDIPGIVQLLKYHYIYNAVLGELYGKAGNIAEAWRLLEQAYDLTPSHAEKKLFRDKIDKLPES